MNTTSERRLTIIAIRAAGILIVLIGLILTTSTVISLMAVSSLTSNIPRGMNVNIKGPVGSMGAWAILGQLSVSAWGAAVYLSANWLSSFILPETTVTTAASSDS